MKAGETMKKKEQKIVRFYSDNPEHRKAFDILQKINAEKYSSRRSSPINESIPMKICLASDSH